MLSIKFQKCLPINISSFLGILWGLEFYVFSFLLPFFPSLFGGFCNLNFYVLTFFSELIIYLDRYGRRPNKKNIFYLYCVKYVDIWGQKNRNY